MRRVRVVRHLDRLEDDNDAEDGGMEIGAAEGGDVGDGEPELVRDADLGEPDAELEVAAIHIAPADRGQVVVQMHPIL